MNPTLEALSLNQTPIVTFGYIMQVLFSLIIVLGIIYLAARYVLPRLQFKSRGTILSLEDRIGLDPQVTAYVIRAEEKRWVIVVSKNNVAVVDKLEEA
ncbi:MAG: hypothetical protein KKB81_07430 [Candidatus Margulisbacteria bacterium]|nr:hypothetical protein [Candidatus Margulisiibacteriota bacterium]MBU1021182.1 hypothetical protein [Candidatus Margulisiibacteriota bacterium]MBU1729788.1 hypothetical protein [Candidatus Margulisiibacteriota bacterium]MBU1955289.1 hypothetical protein [Candidatus Margulisiibacteriota bacterium]